MANRLKFIELFLDSLKQDYRTGGAKRLIPYWLIFFVGIGFALSFNIPALISLELLIKVIAALITAQGIILAMSMQASGTILTNISQSDFNSYLKSHGLLNYYMLLVQFIQGVHLISLFLLLGSAFACLFDDTLSPVAFRIVFALAIGMFMYAMRWAWGTSIIVRDLIYYRSEFQYGEAIKKLVGKDSGH